MALTGQRICYTFKAGADLSADANHFNTVTLASDGDVNPVTNAATALQAIGILENTPKNGEAATVCVFGRAKAIVGGAVTPGAWLHVDNDGHLVATTTAGDPVVGRALESGANGQIISVLVDFVSRQHYGA